MLVRACSVLLASILLVGCDCGAGPRECQTVDDCGPSQLCVDGTCRDRSTVDGGSDAGRCGARVECNGVCCPESQICNEGRCALDCGGGLICGGVCCAAGQQCVENACAAACEDNARLCGASNEFCCTAQQSCLNDRCVDLGRECTLTEECPADAFCLPSLMRCVPRDSVEVCEYRPMPRPFAPRIGCQWRPPAGPSATYQDVVMTPSVMNMTDDNGDGRTDRNDIPDVVFVAFDRPTDGCCTARGRLVIASGACNRNGTMTTLAMLESPFLDNSTGIALGNLHRDTNTAELAPEIVATFQGGGASAFRRTRPDGTAWAELWRNMNAPAATQAVSGATPALADLDANGAPEVIIGNVVLNGLTGAVVWDGRVTVGPTAGVGNNAFLGPSSTVADIDLDGDLEVIAGNTVYEGRTGAHVWTYAFVGDNAACGGTLPCDGYNAVGNFDDDPQAEVVIVRRGQLFVLQHTGELLHRVNVPVDDCRNNEGGPPTIADFDGDGRAEVGIASSDYYVVFDFQCTGAPLPAGCARENVRWFVPNRDCSSRVTGSSVFDFEGDGAAEVIYADEESFRIFDGRTGNVLFDDPTHRSNTRFEMPIVVDVDNDGKSEIVLPEPNPDTPGQGGIEIWEDTTNNWVRTRRVWNQHTYHVTNINEDGQVPRMEEPNWSNGRLNNFRQNVQPGGLFDAPDLQVESVLLAECIGSGTVRIAVTVTNAGALGVPPGVSVRLRATPEGGAAQEVGVMPTTRTLLPGQRETLTFTWTVTGGFTFDRFTAEATIDVDGAYNECIEDNNARTSDPLLTCTFG